MSTSYTRLGEVGFWASDTLLEIWAYYLARQLERTTGAQWVKGYARHLHEQAVGGMSGCIDFRLSDLDDGQRAALARVAVDVLERMEGEPELLKAESLSRLGLGGGAIFSLDVDRRSLEKVAGVFIQLLDGKWRWRVDDPESMPEYWMADHVL